MLVRYAVLILTLLSSFLQALHNTGHFEIGSSSRPSQQQTLEQILHHHSTSSSSHSSEWSSAEHPVLSEVEKDEPVPELSGQFRDMILIPSSVSKKVTMPSEASRKGKEVMLSPIETEARRNSHSIGTASLPDISRQSVTSEGLAGSNSMPSSARPRSRASSKRKKVVSDLIDRLCKSFCFSNKRQ